jgi:hypothetical protein
MAGEEQPDWARMIHYPIPEAFGVPECRVGIFEFVPGQTPFAAQRARGLYEFERGDWTAAIHHLERALQIKPGDEEISRWLPALQRKAQATAPSN